MSMFLGSTPITAVYVGSTPVQKIYLGTTEVWSASATNPVVVEGSAVASGNSITLPPHSPGDIFVMFANGVFGGGPSAPAAGGTVPTWNLVSINNASTEKGALFYAVATASNHTSGTFSKNSGGLGVVVLSGQSAASPVGGFQIDRLTESGQQTAPSITLAQADGTSAVLHFYSANQFTYTWGSAPAGYTQLQPPSGSSWGAILTKDATTTDGSCTITRSSGNGTHVTASIEIRAH